VRITVHLDTFDSADPSAYAILWLAPAEHKWSCEGHAGMHLPAWGMLEPADNGVRVTAPDVAHPLFVLDDFAYGSGQDPYEGASGEARWYRHAHHTPVTGHWHVQCVDTESTEPEHRLFADDAS
jgi:hypothetical protein